MKTMQEVQTLISDLQQFYTDVRLLDAATIERIEEGVRSNPNAEELCYACRHRNRRCHHCAVKNAFENHDQRTKLEYFSPDIVQVSAKYMEVDGAPYVLELLQRMHSDTIVEPDDTEALFSALSGYNTKLYHDPLTDMYNRRYYEEIVRGMKGPIGVALMDLDDFKVYNDTYGHHAGDIALSCCG
jgi:putative two-component system response regulator